LEVLDLLRGISLKMKIKEPFRLLPPFPIKNSCSEAGGREGESLCTVCTLGPLERINPPVYILFIH
jgi:hypothetical protein